MKRIINTLSDGNRENKYDIFMRLLKPDKDSRILDVGASEREYRLTSNYLEKRYPNPERITVLGIDSYKQFCNRYPDVRVVKYEGSSIPFKDNAFDICWCNAVIEHVGDRGQQENFIREIQRVSKHAFITTPNKYFIFEAHTKMFILHYLPKKIFEKILIKIGKTWATGSYMNLLGRNDIVNLLEKCHIEKYKLIENKMLGFTFDFIIVF